ncbi:Imm10 family immunity protein [Streptomyces avermitilis]|uniref:Imm10 family immunity protein n=1 Tax=Streptomyces avermitilis TaxID=33903 RepID=UPI003410F729
MQENVPDSCFIVGLAEDEYGEGRYLTFQCGLEAPGVQERRLGLDGYCISNETGGVHYGGIESVVLSAGEISFRFSSEVIRELSLSAQEVILEITSDVDVESLRDGLRRILTYGNLKNLPGVLQL